MQQTINTSNLIRLIPLTQAPAASGEDSAAEISLVSNTVRAYECVQVEKADALANRISEHALTVLKNYLTNCAHQSPDQQMTFVIPREDLRPCALRDEMVRLLVLTGQPVVSLYKKDYPILAYRGSNGEAVLIDNHGQFTFDSNDFSERRKFRFVPTRDFWEFPEDHNIFPETASLPINDETILREYARRSRGYAQQLKGLAERVEQELPDNVQVDFGVSQWGGCSAYDFARIKVFNDKGEVVASDQFFRALRGFDPIQTLFCGEWLPAFIRNEGFFRQVFRRAKNLAEDVAENRPIKQREYDRCVGTFF